MENQFSKSERSATGVSSAGAFNVENWGVVPYQEALERQLAKVAVMGEAICVASSPCSLSEPETLVVCSHPPVVTLGRGTKPGDVFGWSGETAEVSRGGRATYHGPSQLVVYPILNLNKARPEMPARDLHAYMRMLEEAVIETLGEFGIEAGTHDDFATPPENGLWNAAGATGASSADPSFTGVWVKVVGADGQAQVKKIASIGIGVKKWISYHGLALNVDHDPKAHTGINPCGFQTQVMTSVEEVLGKAIDRKQVEEMLVSFLKKNLEI